MEDTSWWRQFRTTRETADSSYSDKFPHLQLVTSIDEGYAPTYEHSMELWIQYKNTAQIQGTPITNNMEQMISILWMMPEINCWSTRRPTR